LGAYYAVPWRSPNVSMFRVNDKPHVFQIVDAEFDILSVNRANWFLTLPLTILDSGSAFISQYLIPRSSLWEAEATASVVPLTSLSSFGAASLLFFVRLRDSGRSYSQLTRLHGFLPLRPQLMPRSCASVVSMALPKCS